MAFMLVLYNHDYDEWKAMFDADPVGRAKGGAKAHAISRGVDDPNDIFVRLEFGSVDDARAFRDTLVASGVLDRMNVKLAPTVVDVVETQTY